QGAILVAPCFHLLSVYSDDHSKSFNDGNR
ncbi:formate dehydrogenase cytochrome b556 subunit, partial [Salmonella enterica]